MLYFRGIYVTGSVRCHVDPNWVPVHNGGDPNWVPITKDLSRQISPEYVRYQKYFNVGGGVLRRFSLPLSFVELP